MLLDFKLYRKKSKYRNIAICASIINLNNKFFSKFLYCKEIICIKIHALVLKVIIKILESYVNFVIPLQNKMVVVA